MCIHRQRFINSNRPLAGISSCLLGHAVRYDGLNKSCVHIRQLEKYLEFVPICPEVGAGMSVPRPAIHMIRVNGELKLVGVEDNSLDVTEALTRYCEQVAGRLGPMAPSDFESGSELAASAGISGYIFKSNSPSCGLKIRIFENRMPSGTGAGIFAATLMDRYPLLPVIEETGLQHRSRRHRFIKKVLVYDAWKRLCGAKPSIMQIRAIHKRYRPWLRRRDLNTLERKLRDIKRVNNPRSRALYLGALLAAIE